MKVRAIAAIYCIMKCLARGCTFKYFMEIANKKQPLIPSHVLLSTVMQFITCCIEMWVLDTLSPPVHFKNSICACSLFLFCFFLLKPQ